MQLTVQQMKQKHKYIHHSTHINKNTLKTHIHNQTIHMITRRTLIVLVWMQPVKSWRWSAWPMSASCNWVELLQVSSELQINSVRVLRANRNSSQERAYAGGEANVQSQQESLGMVWCCVSIAVCRRHLGFVLWSIDGRRRWSLCCAVFVWLLT